jgi:hypothetical protein
MRRLLIAVSVVLATATVPTAAEAAGRIDCASPAPHNTRLAVKGGGSCRTARAVARAANEQYALAAADRRLGVEYSIDPYTPGPRIWNCRMQEARRGGSMVLYVNCIRSGRRWASDWVGAANGNTVMMIWTWRRVWMD